MTREQDKIDIEVEAVKVLHIKENGAAFAVDDSVIDWLKKRGYIVAWYPGVSSRYRAIKITEEGRDYLNASMSNTRISAAVNKWKTEVATGMTDSGNESQIENPAVPKTPKPEYRPPDILRKFRESISARQQVAQELGISIDALLNFASEGRLRVCNKGEQHFGLFDRDKNHPSGWSYNCRRCRREK